MLLPVRIFKLNNKVCVQGEGGKANNPHQLIMKLKNNLLNIVRLFVLDNYDGWPLAFMSS